MQALMDRLGAFLERRRWLVLGIWLVLLLAALPFAARQTENLTGGGFSVPGSGSEAVDKGLERFEGAQKESLAVVLAQRPSASAADVRAQVDRVDRIAARMDLVELSDRADMTVDLRDEVGAGKPPVDGVQPYLVGQQAMWAGMQDLTKEDLESAEKAGFPIVLLILLAVFGSLAAAALPLTLGFASVALTGAAIYFLSQATAMSVFVTNVASMIGIGVAGCQFF